MPPETSNNFFPPASTGVHNNIDNLILQAELNKFAQTGVMYADKTPEYIGGTGDVVANVAMSPLIAAKKIPSLLKTIKDIGLRNPLYHFTSAPRAQEVFKTGMIKPTGSFPSTKISLQKKIPTINNPNRVELPRAFSVTRAPKFASRSHKHIPTDVRFIMDRDDLIRKG